MNRVFYTYILVDLRKPGRYTYDDCNLSFLYEPFYVGKGTGERYCTGKNDYANRVMKILGPPSLYSILIKFDGVEELLSEDLSFLHEVRFIKQIGRSDLRKGPLLNFTDGGEGPSGLKMSPESRMRMSLAKVGKPQSYQLVASYATRKGKPKSKSHCEAIARSNTGKLHSPEAKEKMSKLKLGRKHTVESRDLMSKSHLGSRGTMTGKFHSEETRKKMSESHKGRKPTDKARENMRIAALSRKNAGVLSTA